MYDISLKLQNKYQLNEIFRGLTLFATDAREAQRFPEIFAFSIL